MFNIIHTILTLEETFTIPETEAATGTVIVAPFLTIVGPRIFHMEVKACSHGMKVVVCHTVTVVMRLVRSQSCAEKYNIQFFPV